MLVYYFAGTNLQTFQEALSSLGNMTAVKGLGQAAYSGASSSSDPNQNEVAALFGTLEISVTADASVAHEVALLKTISARI